MNETEHLLEQLAEECCEVAVRVSKALRFGLDEVQPGQPLTNAERIKGELCDVCGLVELLAARGILSEPTEEDEERVKVKKEKVLRYLDYAMGRAPHPEVR